MCVLRAVSVFPMAAKAKANRKLEQLLNEVNTSEQHANLLSSDLHSLILTGLQKWDPCIEEYDPLIEIAKIGMSAESESDKLRAHTTIASYMYPQIGRVEVHNKEDKNINIKIEIADYAKESILEIEPEDIEIEGEIEAEKPRDYTDFVLKSLPKSKLD